MPFGAHEAMEVHEVLSEKINMINHFNFYASQTKNQELRDIIMRHQQEEMKTYDAVVSYTHDYHSFSPIPPNTSVNNVQPDQIQYGLDNPTMIAPESNAVFNDFEVANALLQCHKNAASNGVKATLEIADPNLRQLLLNSAVNCIDQAYEVFLFMNRQGLYQVPQLKDHTAKTYLHSYQPIGESIKAQYKMQPGQNLGQDQAMMTYMNENQMNHSPQMSAPYVQNISQGQMMGTSGQQMRSGGGMSAGGQHMASAPSGGMIGGASGGQQMRSGEGMTTTGAGQQPITPNAQMGTGKMNVGYQAQQTNMQQYRGNQHVQH